MFTLQRDHPTKGMDVPSGADCFLTLHACSPANPPAMHSSTSAEVAGRRKERFPSCGQNHPPVPHQEQLVLFPLAELESALSYQLEQNWGGRGLITVLEGQRGLEQLTDPIVMRKPVSDAGICSVPFPATNQLLCVRPSPTAWCGV